MHRVTETESSSEIGHDQIMLALNEVLESDKFTAAPQMSAFLKYVVEQAASGNMSRIKAYTVAIDALGKPDSFDPQNDPVVRVLAGRLRAALSSYYEIHTDASVRILMRPGSYVPSFVAASTTKAASPSENNNRVKSSSSSSSTIGKSDSKTTENHTKRSSAAQGHETTVNQAVLNESARTAEPTPDTVQAAQTPDKAQNSSRIHFLRQGKFKWLFPLPVAGLALAALGIFVGSKLSGFKGPSEENINSSASAVTASIRGTQTRPRPEKVSLFVSAIGQDNALNDQLNTMMSGVFSQSNDIRVYRILESSNSPQHWPEDYVVSVDVLPLASETRVNIQLVEALTGRLTHSHDLTLSKAATDGLNEDELNTINEYARELISTDGPLFEDYAEKLTALE